MYFALAPNMGAEAMRTNIVIPKKVALEYERRKPILLINKAQGIPRTMLAMPENEDENNEKASLPPSMTRNNIIMALLSLTHSDMQPNKADEIA